MRFTCFLFLALGLALSSAAQASPGALCVEQQLAAAKFDPGPVDGKIDDATKKAFASFAAKRGLRAKVPLHEFSAMSYCRQIGLKISRLKRQWPSRKGAFDFHVGKGVDRQVAKRIQSQLKKARPRMAKFFKLELPGRDKVVIGASAGVIGGLVEQHTEYPGRSIASVARRHCSNKGGIGAFVLPGLAVFCVQPGYRSKNENWQREIDFVTAHELVHLVQTQVAGTSAPGSSAAAKLERDGPVWLVEGFANAYAISGRTGISAAEGFLFSNSFYDGKRIPSLKTLEKRSALHSHYSDVYDAGTIAAIDLVGLKGAKSYGRYLDILATGASWQAAFKAAFGMTPEAFYKRFDRRYRS
ncbi:hypothetical protein AIOL_001138 [Candidatus Rhodobacter oscarellae]|uniref:Uncharacterized protein n=1 Tax=Candidatus Rhodobacter oscarellae TaxID=1675527 RepID=A0A0J9DZU3_9RHOB|nr:hypothetical protein [Candidatus Rhodobacter lobularis]KMW56186.1 hypothetical protein AIOL_001138 [Candidatus Rhodobacter lobularis]